MAIIVEDGTGKTDADSYCSVDTADQYFSARGVSEWGALTVPVKEQSLVKATDYIDMRFGLRFAGHPNFKEQSLAFPRNNETTLPRGLVRACAEYALRASTKSLTTDPIAPNNGSVVKSETKKLGPLEKVVEYEKVGSVFFNVYPAADALLAPLFRSKQVVR